MNFDKALDIMAEAGYSRHSWNLTQHDIAECVTRENWQAKRVTLKGLSTKQKVIELANWYGEGIMTGPQEAFVRWVQVTNYLNALKRGGQLK